VLPTLTHVRAVSFLTDSVKLQLAHQVFEAQVPLAAGSPNLEPGRLALWKRFDAVATGYLI
jgi:hypothetical protein